MGVDVTEDGQLSGSNGQSGLPVLEGDYEEPGVVAAESEEKRRDLFDKLCSTATGARDRIAARPPPPERDHIHDFHTGTVKRCSVCGETMAEAALQSGGRLVGPAGATDDGWRAPEATTRALGGRIEPRPTLETIALTRMDVVAHDWSLKRRPGEDDDSLAVRVRRACAGLGMVRRPAVPPMDWTPPPGYRLGDPWKGPK